MAHGLRWFVAASAAAAVVGGGVVPAASTSAAESGRLRARIIFDKRAGHPWDSTITWVAKSQQADGTWRLLARDSWRAGSGFPGRATTNPCVKDHGWLPNGRYALRQADDWHGNLIHGRVFRLADKRCADGTLREQLFIHTETGPGNTQCPDRPGDQVCRWEFPRINDYTSHGCIKMAPADLLALTRDYHRYFRPRVRYSVTRVALVVR